MILTLLLTDEPSRWISSNPNGCAHCSHHVSSANQIVSVWERPAIFLGQAAAIKHTSELGFLIFKGYSVLLHRTVQCTIRNDCSMNVLAKSGHILSSCFVSLQIIAYNEDFF
jgi:hypothetical protein